MKQHSDKKCLRKKWLLGGLVSFLLLFAIPTATEAQTVVSVTHAFRRIEQPLGLKLGVAAAGIGLIGLELWWFLFSQNKAQTAQLLGRAQAVDRTRESRE